ncbi:MAG: cobalamin-dependent protein [Treponema sp.]|jgi:methanogenic corrinoid protein MtbC1|nr:cobalamin-dependent protein [Treponema sp.]
MEKLSDLLSEMRFDEAMKLGIAMAHSESFPDFQSEIIEGLHKIETKYNNGELFIADLIVAGSVIRDIFSLAKDSPFMKRAAISGTMVIGTIVGDIHNIGKDLFADALRYRGITVVDLGVDVPIERFLDAVDRHQPDILAISTYIEPSLTNTKILVNRLRQAGIPPGMKIIVGGSAVDERFTKIPGADYVSRDYQKSIDFCANLLKEKHGGRAGAGV